MCCKVKTSNRPLEIKKQNKTKQKTVFRYGYLQSKYMFADFKTENIVKMLS